MNNNLFILSISFFISATIHAMEQVGVVQGQTLIRVECCDGTIVTLRKDLAYQSDTIAHLLRDFEYFQSKFEDTDNHDVTFMDINVAGEPLDSNIIEEVFTLADALANDRNAVKEIVDKKKLIALFNVALYLEISPLLRHLTHRAYQCMRTSELQEYPILKKGTYLYSIKNFIKDNSVDSVSIQDYISISENEHSLCFVHQELESLSGLKQLFEIIRLSSLRCRINGIDVSNNNLVKLNFYKLLKFGIQKVHACNNRISSLVFPDHIPDHSMLSLEHNNIIGWPEVTIGETSKIYLNNNPISAHAVKILESYKRIPFLKKHKKTVGSLPYWIPLLGLPILYWGSVIGCCIYTVMNPDETWIDRGSLGASIGVGLFHVPLLCTLCNHLRREKYKSIKEYVKPKIKYDKEA